MSAALKVKPTEPAPEPMLSCDTVVASAVPSTVDNPLGNVLPPDHVAENRLLLTVWVSVEVDVGEGERTRGGLIERRVVLVVHDFGSRVRSRSVDRQHRCVFSAGDDDRDLLRRGDDRIVRDRHVVGDGQRLASRPGSRSSCRRH